MKQLLSLFLFLLPCLAWAQYPSNGNQKITLGEQTTADGLIYRGLAADTTRKPSIDTMAYIILDTATNIQWQYKKATSNAWLRIGGSISSGLTGTLPVANGGTNTSTAFTAGSVVFAGSGGTYTQDNSNLFWNKDKYNFGVGVIPTNSSDGLYSHLQLGESGVIAAYYSGASLINFGQNFYNNGGWKRLAANSSTQIHLNTGEIEFRVAPTGSTNSAITWTAAMNIDNTGKIGLGISSPTEKLHVVGNGLFTGNVGIGSATPTTSGSGITFPATQSASTNANTLDDYEEGTWTTTFGAKGNLTGTPSLSSAIYRKIGQIVYIEGRVGGLTITTSNTTTYIIFSVPIAMNNNSTSQVGNVYTYTGSTDMSGIITDATNGDNTTVAIIIPNALVTAGSLSDLLFSITYIANN
jgi:hypothetical protein